MSTDLVSVPAARSVLAGLLPAVLTDDPDDRLVTDTLLDRVDIAAELEQLIDGLADLLERATSPHTRRAYESDFAHFAGRARDHALVELPAMPQTIALYITAQQDTLRPASLLRRLSAIAVGHRAAGFDSPTSHELVRRAVAGLRRKHGARPAAKSALVTAQLAVVCSRLWAFTETPAAPSAEPAPARQAQRRARAAATTALRARRDRALLLVGYAAALRRSELVALNVGDLGEDGDGTAGGHPTQQDRPGRQGTGDNHRFTQYTGVWVSIQRGKWGSKAG